MQDMIVTSLQPRAPERPRPELLRLAVEEFYARSTRRRHPEGEWQDGLWYPLASERRSCCEGFQPSLANRQALESHCRTQAHAAALYGVPVGELKAAVREDRKKGSPIGQQVASSFVGPRPRGTGAEAFRDMRRRSRLEAFEKLQAALADGLPLLERLHALKAAEDPDEETLAPLLETATVSAERVVASLHYARHLEGRLTCANALLETLQAGLEAPKPRGRRSRASAST